MTLKLYRIALCAIASLVLLGTGGCQTLTDVYNEIFNPSPQMPDGPGVEATIWPGPRVRPGVALAITVTASGITNRDSKQYFVDAEGCITMELIGSIKVDQLSLMQLQQKITAAMGDAFDLFNMETTYYDTPSGALSARRWTLRRRKENGVSVCALKTPGEGFGHGEWEVCCEKIEKAVGPMLGKGAPKELYAFLQSYSR